MPFVDNCYLIKYAAGWMLWDTGQTDALAAMPEGQKPADPKATHWYRPKTLASQLEQLGVKPADIKIVAVSHTHPDHVGNVEMFPQSMLLVQKAEYEWPNPLRPATPVRIRPRPRCRKWPTSWRRKRPRSGSTTTRRSATA